MFALNAKYEMLTRKSDFGEADQGADASEAAFLKRYVRRFDAANKKKNTAKLGVDFMVIDNLDFGIEYSMYTNDYNETTLGRKSNSGSLAYLGGAYVIPDMIEFDFYYGMETSKKNSYHRACSSDCDPNSVATSSQYNWDMDSKIDGAMYGLGIKYTVLDEMLWLKFAYDYDKTDGSTKFKVQDDVTTKEDIDVSNDFKHSKLTAKAIYKFNENLSATAGLIVEEIELKDVKYDDYTYGVANGSSRPWNGVLTGALADNTGKANYAFAAVSYLF
jgi:hypothetical protein